MKKTIACICILFGVLGARAEVRTNYVYIVSNIFNNVYTETIVTQKVKSSHTDFYYTNYVSVVTNVYQTMFRTNVSVNVDVSQAYVNAAANAASNALSFADQSAASASAADSSASTAISAASRAAASASAASSAASDGLQRINERINWFDLHSGKTITVVNHNTNIDVHVAQTIITNDFRNVPYDLDPNLQVNLNAFALFGKGGTQNVYRVSAPGSPYLTQTSGGSMGSISISSFDMKFDRFELLDGKAKFWYKSDYFAGMAYNGNCVTWRFKWAYHYNGVWHVAIDQETYSDFNLTGTQTFEMTLSAAYPSGTGTFANRPSNTWSPSNSSFGRLTVPSYSTAMEYLARIALKDEVDHELGIVRSDVSSLSVELNNLSSQISQIVADNLESLSGRVETVASSISQLQILISNLGSRMDQYDSGSPYAYVSPGGTAYSNITIYRNAVDQGKVSVGTVGNYYASTMYRFYPAYGGNVSSAFWTFSPAFVDFDSEGLRIHYVANERRTITAATYNAGYQYVPTDFYWQNGSIYIVIDSYNGSTWSGKIVTKYSGTGANAYPARINGTSSDTSTSYYNNTTFVSRTGTIMGTSTSFTVGHLKTANGSYLSNYDSLLWIPESPSAIQQATLAWIASFGTSN